MQLIIIHHHLLDLYLFWNTRKLINIKILVIVQGKKGMLEL